MTYRDPKPENGPLFDTGDRLVARLMRNRDEHRERTIEQRFDHWWKHNQHVVRRIVELALEAKAAGVDRYGMKALFEVVRWDRRIRARCDGFKLNNNFTALCARRIMDEVPELAGFFETRGTA